MGNPDGPTPPHIVAKLIEAVQNPKAHGYSTSKGIPGLRRAYAAYYARRFNVELDPEREIVVTLGSKEGFANLAQAITAPGDTVIVPNPSYPIHSFGFIMAGAAVRHVPIGPGVDFLDELKKAVKHSIPAPLAIVLNFPANPTAMTVDLDFYGEIVDFCRHHNIWMLSDLAYAEIYFDDTAAAFDLRGAGGEGHRGRVHLAQQDLFDGRLAHRLRGRQPAADRGADPGEVVSRLRRLHPDPGRGDRGAQRPAGLHRRNPRALQGAARRAGRRPASRPAGTSRRPTRRCSPGRRCPRNSRASAASPSPSCCSSAPMSRSSPGVGFGEHGEGFVRIALVENRQRLRQATRNIKAFLAGRNDTTDLRRAQRMPPRRSSSDQSPITSTPRTVARAAHVAIERGERQ